MDPSPPRLTKPSDEQAVVIFRGACRGALGGALWSLPVSALCVAVCWNTPRFGSANALLVGVWTTVVWSSIAAFIGGLRARVETASNPHEALIRREVGKAALGGALFSLPVVLLMLVYVWEEAGPWAALLQSGMVMGIWVGSAAAVGHTRAVKKVARLLEDEADAQAVLASSAWMEGRLEKWGDHPERLGVQQALEARFGPLTPQASVRLGACSEERLREIERGAGEAGSLRELGLED